MKKSPDKILKYDLGLIAGKIIFYIGDFNLSKMQKIAGNLGGVKTLVDPGHETCFGLCYNLGFHSLIWISGENNLEQTVEAIAHELSHAIDGIFDCLGYSDGELRARLHGAITAKAISELKLIRTK